MKRKILVALDSNSVQKIVAAACKNEKAVIKKTGDGTAAFNLLDKFNPDLVVAETYLPFMSGIQLCQKIKNSKKLSSIKVLLLTDQSEYLTEKERLALRVDGILAKPGYPTVMVPFGLLESTGGPSMPEGFNPKPRPSGVSFAGTACSEPRLLELAYAFEQASMRRVAPTGMR